MLPASRVATIVVPGATMSGFVNPSWVMPLLENGAISSSLRSMVWFTSTAPTVITNGSSPGLLIAPGPAVPRRDHDGDPGGPGALHGGVQRIERVRLDAVGSEREVQHLDPVLRAMRDDPLERRDHDRDVGRPVRAGDLQRDELRAGGDPAPLAVGGGAVPGDHAREVRPVSVLVVAGAAGREVHSGDDALAEVLDLCDPGVDHRDRDAAPVDGRRGPAGVGSTFRHARFGSTSSQASVPIAAIWTVRRGRRRGSSRRGPTSGVGRPGRRRRTRRSGEGVS